MYIKIGNKEIHEPIINMLRQAKSELTNGKLKEIKSGNSSNCVITCPSHKNGLENRPSCMILTDPHGELEAGFAHCFTCGYNARFPQVIGDLFNQDEAFGEEWILERFGNVFVETEELLPKIELKPSVNSPKILDESILLKYDFYHPYMWKRHLSKEIVDQFRVGYDKERNAITFPVYDEKHRLVMITARCVDNKRFYIPEGVEKPVYLLYDLIERGETTAFVAESQINALTLRTFGYPGIALFGTGTTKQYEILKKSGIRNYILAFDGDSAGEHGAQRFKNNMPKDVFITELKLPAGKDVNDLTKEEFDYLLKIS